MNAPKNQVAEVLYELITEQSITRMSIMKGTGILNLTARIADLRIRHGLNVICDKVNTKNKHGRPISYGSWRLLNKKIAISKYDKINKDE